MNKIKSNISIKEVKEASKEIYNAMIELLSQLTSSELAFSQKDLERIVASNSSILFTALDETLNNKIVGILTLAIIDIPTGMLAKIEDVVVDKSCRGQKLGETIVESLKDIARQKNCYKVILQSSSKNLRFYEKAGFKKRDYQLEYKY